MGGENGEAIGGLLGALAEANSKKSYLGDGFNEVVDVARKKIREIGLGSNFLLRVEGGNRKG